MSGVTTASSAVCQRMGLSVAIVAPDLGIIGGQGVQASDLYKSLEKDGYSVNFIAVNKRFPRGLLWAKKIQYLRTVINQVFYIASLFRLRKVDVVHVFSASYWSFLLAPVPAMLVARLFGKRVILNYHSGEAEKHLSGWGKRVHPWLRLAHEIVVPSQFLHNTFLRHGYQTRVIHNIVNTDSFCWRERKPLRPVLLSARNLEAYYDVENTLKAFEIIKHKVPEARLIIAGSGTEENRLRLQVENREIGNVTFLGAVAPSRMPEVFDSADIFINSSVLDNQPVSVLEAMSAGLCVVSTAPGDIPAMIKDGVSGLLVGMQDPEGMARAVLQLLSDPDRALDMTHEARKALEHFHWSEIGRQWLRVYQGKAA